jgi:hypothetical protein
VAPPTDDYVVPYPDGSADDYVVPYPDGSADDYVVPCPDGCIPPIADDQDWGDYSWDSVNWDDSAVEDNFDWGTVDWGDLDWEGKNSDAAAIDWGAVDWKDLDWEGKQSDAKQIEWESVEWEELDWSGEDADNKNIDWGEVKWTDVDKKAEIEFEKIEFSELDKKDYKALAKKFNKRKDLELGSASSDKLKGSKKSETMIGAFGNDTIDGGGGKDKIIGAAPESGGGKREVDEMTGGKDKDLFVLGTEDGVLYDDGKKKKNGKKDYAVITDFNPKQDSMQLHGSRDDYFVDDRQKNGQGWQGIVYDSNQNGLLDRSDELIAQIPADLGLRDSVLEKSIRNADFV